MNKINLGRDGTDVVVSVRNDDEIGAFQVGLLYPNLTLGKPEIQAPFKDMEFFYSDKTGEKRILMLALDFDLPLTGIPTGPARPLIRIPFTRSSAMWGCVVIISDFTKVFDMQGDGIPLTLGGPLFIM